MLEWQDSKLGAKVPIFKQKRLASLNDPILEAQRWVQNHHVQKGENLIVFSFGGGFHIDELIKLTKNVIIIEFNRSIPIKTDCDVFQTHTEVSQLMDMIDVSKYRILEFKPAMQFFREDYALAKWNFLARTSSGFKKQMRFINNELAKDFMNLDLVESTSLPSGQKLLSIKDIKEKISKLEKIDKDLLIFNALGELVK